MRAIEFQRLCNILELEVDFFVRTSLLLDFILQYFCKLQL